MMFFDSLINTRQSLDSTGERGAKKRHLVSSERTESSTFPLSPARVWTRSIITLTLKYLRLPRQPWLDPYPYYGVSQLHSSTLLLPCILKPTTNPGFPPKLKRKPILTQTLWLCNPFQHEELSGLSLTLTPLNSTPVYNMPLLFITGVQIFSTASDILHLLGMGLKTRSPIKVNSFPHNTLQYIELQALVWLPTKPPYKSMLCTAFNPVSPPGPGCGHWTYTALSKRVRSLFGFG